MHQRPAEGPDRQDRHRHRAQQPDGRSTRWSKALGNQGGLYRSNDAGESWTLVNSSQRPARAAVLLPLRQRQSEERERSLGERAGPAASRRDGGKTFTHGRRRRTATTTACGSIPTTRSIILQVNDGGANVSLNGGKQLVVDPQSADRRVLHGGGRRAVSLPLYMPQQDNTTIVIPSVPTGVVGLRSSGAGVARRRRAARPAASGRSRMARWCGARARARSSRFNVADRPGAGTLGLSAEPLRARSGRHQVPLPAPDRRLCLAARSEDRLPGVARAASHRLTKASRGR